MARRAVFLDRDGVLVRTDVRDGKPYAVHTLDAFELMPDARAATAALKDMGFLLIVVTNQPDVGKGLIPIDVLQEMHDRLKALLPVDAIYACCHRQDENCDCRKPRPGLLLRAAADFGIDLTASYMVGDRQSDVVAGELAGCYTILIERGYLEPMSARANACVNGLSEAAARVAEHAAPAGGTTEN